MRLGSTHYLAALAAIVVAACSTPRGGGAADAPAQETQTPGIASAPFGREGNTPVQLYTLTNKNGLIAKISNYGAIVTELHAPDRNGRLADVVLGFDNLDGYLAGHPYFGAIVGRVANRIRNAEFALEGSRYTLAAEGPRGDAGSLRLPRGCVRSSARGRAGRDRDRGGRGQIVHTSQKHLRALRSLSWPSCFTKPQAAPPCRTAPEA